MKSMQQVKGTVNDPLKFLFDSDRYERQDLGKSILVAPTLSKFF